MTKVAGVFAKGLVCAKCRHKTYTLSQAKEVIRLIDLEKTLNKKRKIIRIGNSRGIALPDVLGIKVGGTVVTEALAPKSFVVKIKN